MTQQIYELYRNLILMFGVVVVGLSLLAIIFFDKNPVVLVITIHIQGFYVGFLVSILIRTFLEDKQ